MNCSEFETIVVDLAQSEARGVLLNVTMKQRGLQHAQSCVPCAGRLKLEQNLSRSLRAVATGDQSLSAPSSVEVALLAAFRRQQDAAPVAANVIVPTVQESPLQRWFSQLKWALIPAAVAALALIVFAVTRVTQPTTQPSPVIVENNATPTPIATPSMPEQIEMPAPPPLEPREDLVINASTRRLPKQVKATPLQPLTRHRNGSVTVDVGEFELVEPEAISAKDFLVFDYAQNLPPADSTHLMRVRMPRERLAPLGIPLPRGTRDENFVNADFLVGSDGVPRAIRVANR